MKREKMKLLINLKFFFLATLLSHAALSQDRTEKSAFEIWTDMTEASITQNETKTYVKDAPGVDADSDSGKYVMFGGEKEGSSSLITRVMGPKQELLREWINTLPADKREVFLKDFLRGIASGKYRVKEVKNLAGEVLTADWSDLKRQNYQSMNLAELDEKFNIFLNKTGDQAFAHLTPATRTKIFNGKFPGLDTSTSFKKYTISDSSRYTRYVPLAGTPEKYISAAHKTGVGGWEINFKPQPSYGEFERMISWFRDTLKNAGQRFEAPGHQWVVYPKNNDAKNAEKSAQVIEKLNELHKNNQALIILKAIEGDAGIEYANHKRIQTNENLGDNHKTTRGVVRLENNRFKVDQTDSFGVEFRAGTKSDPIRRRLQKFLISRYAANELDDLAPGKSWDLNRSLSFTREDLIARFGIDPDDADKFFVNIDKAKKAKIRNGTTSFKTIDTSFLVPLWNWEGAPYLSSNKKAEMGRLTQEFIKTVAELENPTKETISQAMKSWVKVSRISADVENYLKPKPKISDNAHVLPLKENARVDVNKIDMGIEYTARFPTGTDADYVAVPGQEGKMEWRKTYFDYTPEDRKRVIRNFAKQLASDLNEGNPVELNFKSANGHGHNLDIAYEFLDKQGRKWRIEWDGVGRSYNAAGEMIPDSVRGGHIEIVTPKSNPSKEDMDKVFGAMKKESLIPSIRNGGGHINVDLKPFDNNPKALARFLGVYYDNRNMMSLLFQHPGRAVGAEPNRASPRLIEKLKTFDGSEEDLKKLLYNEKFFNTRVGRKTKNNQLNMIAYFQDVIPEEYIHEDFDMKNSMWRKTFDVDPKIRKFEFRLFNAPRNVEESALQIKFVKAMLNKALNESDPVFKGNYDINYKKFADDPKAAMVEFEKTMTGLGLDPKEYRAFLIEGLELSKSHFANSKVLTNEQKLKPHPEVGNWGEAVSARQAAIRSEGRLWDGADVTPEAKRFKQLQVDSRLAAERARSAPDIKGKITKVIVPKAIVGSGGCHVSAEDVLNDLMQ
jgi:hypothetical protein